MRATIGSSMVRGSSVRMREMASFTSLRARSWLISRRNSMVVTEEPSVMAEVWCLTPFTPAMASSIFLVTCTSSSEGAAPDW